MLAMPPPTMAPPSGARHQSGPLAATPSPALVTAMAAISDSTVRPML
jgi:hypothetical protein